MEFFKYSQFLNILPQIDFFLMIDFFSSLPICWSVVKPSVYLMNK